MSNEPNQNSAISLGDALAKQKRYEEAIAAYRQAIAQAPSFPSTYIKVAKILFELKRWQEAKAVYRRVTELDPNFRDIPPEILNLGNNKPANTANRQAATQQIATQQQLTIVKLHQQAIQQAPDRLENYYTAIDFQPQDIQLYLGLGNALVRQGYFDKAIVVCRMVLQLNPNLSEAYYYLARIFSHNERYAEAVECWQKFRQLEPNRFHAEECCNLGKALFATEKYTEALIFLRQTLELQPNNYDAHYLLGQILASEKQWGEAIARYQQASKIQPQRWEAYYLLAEIWQEIGKFEEAEKSYRQAIAVKKDISWCYNGLGNVLLKLERWEEAAIAYRQSIALKADFPWAHYNLGEAFATIERIDEAIAAYRQAIRLQPNLARVREKLSRLLRQRAERDLAEALTYEILPKL
jgi:tetratricopeptide (TPR) repeat protein